MKKIHITKLTPAWQIILDQIGIFYQQSTTPDTDILVANSYYAGLEDISETQVILTPQVAAQFMKYSLYYKKNIFLAGEFTDLNPLDVSTGCYNFKKAENLDSGVQKYKNFWILPFQIEDIILNHQKKRKKFYANRAELPSEIVSQTSKGNLRRWLQRLFIKIYQQQNKTYTRRSFMPEPSKSLFIFRIDTDFVKLEDASKLFQLLQKYKLKASWFIEATADDKLMDFYSRLSQQEHEVGLHCLRHRVFKEHEQNLQNLLQGKEILKKNGVQPTGFVAPFGDWNPNLAKAIEKVGFQYSSEFALDYDNLPFYPFFNHKFSPVLQIPIHPISIGRLRRSHFSQTEMIDYFKRIIQQKIAWQEPLIIYHHPGHNYWRVLEAVFREVQDWQNLTMIEYADWWKKRQQAKFEDNHKEIPLYREQGEKFVYTNSPETAAPDLKWQPVIQAPATVNCNLRKWSWRDWLYNFESWRGKVRR